MDVQLFSLQTSSAEHPDLVQLDDEVWSLPKSHCQISKKINARYIYIYIYIHVLPIVCVCALYQVVFLLELSLAISV